MPFRMRAMALLCLRRGLRPVRTAHHPRAQEGTTIHCSCDTGQGHKRPELGSAGAMHAPVAITTGYYTRRSRVNER